MINYLKFGSNSQDNFLIKISKYPNTEEEIQEFIDNMKKIYKSEKFTLFFHLNNIENSPSFKLIFSTIIFLKNYRKLTEKKVEKTIVLVNKKRFD